MLSPQRHLDIRPHTEGGNRLQLAGVCGGDTDAVGFEEPLRAIQALWRQLVVAKRALHSGPQNTSKLLRGVFKVVQSQRCASSWPS